jgi:membrane protein YdbS with pleckstrin-like domain
MSQSNDKLLQSSLPPEFEQGSDDDFTNPIEFVSLADSFPALNAFASSIGWLIIILIQFLADSFIPLINFPWFVSLILVVIAIWSGVYGYFSAKARGYAIDEFDVYFKQGLWWKKQTALNYSRIQHIDISHGPLERKFGLATIKFFTAGGAGSDLRIAGLPKETAEFLRVEILKYATDAIEAGQQEEFSDDASQREQPTAVASGTIEDQKEQQITQSETHDEGLSDSSSKALEVPNTDQEPVEELESETNQTEKAEPKIDVPEEQEKPVVRKTGPASENHE